MTDSSDSAILDTRFPGYAWMPRWTRRYWTPQTAVGLALAVFSTGSWVGTYLTKPDVSGLTNDIADIKFVMGPACVRDCVVKTGDISELKSHVNDLWGMRVDINAELARQQALKAAQQQIPQQIPKRRGSTR